MSTEDIRLTQTTLSNDARVAGRDYFERVDVRRLDDWLALQDDDQRDAISLRNEDVFMKRFRMDLPIPLRSKLLEIKRRGNLTDRRIRHLRSAGVLVQRGDAVELAPSVVGEMVGWSFMVICFLVGMALLVAGANVPLANHALVAYQVLGMVLCVTLAKLCHCTFAEPNRIARQALKRMAA